MADKPYTGLTASVKTGTGVSADVLAYISGFDLNLERAIIEILAFGMEYKEKVAAVKDWNASVNGTVALATGNTQSALYDAFDDGTLLTFGVYLDDDNYFEGEGLVSNFNISGAADDAITLTADIAGSGAIILTLETEEEEGDVEEGSGD